MFRASNVCQKGCPDSIDRLCEEEPSSGFVLRCTNYASLATTRINKKDALLNSLLWQQISVKPIEILDRWRALQKYFFFFQSDISNFLCSEMASILMKT